MVVTVHSVISTWICLKSFGPRVCEVTGWDFSLWGELILSDRMSVFCTSKTPVGEQAVIIHCYWGNHLESGGWSAWAMGGCHLHYNCCFLSSLRNSRITFLIYFIIISPLYPTVLEYFLLQDHWCVADLWPLITERAIRSFCYFYDLWRS